MATYRRASTKLRVTKIGYENVVYGVASPRQPPGIVQLAAGDVRTDLVLRRQHVTTITGFSP